MRSRGFAFAFLATIFSLVLVAFISVACTQQQAQAATNAINATTQPTQNIGNGAANIAAVLPAPLNAYAALVAAGASLALAIEKFAVDYVVPAFTKKSAAGSQTATSTAPKPQVLPS